jgi:ubiquitin C-terminal hydrolase
VLIKHLWYGTHSSYKPGMFKDALRNYQKMFLGDTTEFFKYLLDVLREDLIKVQNKPIIKSNDDTNVLDATLFHNS